MALFSPAVNVKKHISDLLRICLWWDERATVHLYQVALRQMNNILLGNILFKIIAFDFKDTSHSDIQ